MGTKVFLIVLLILSNLIWFNEYQIKDHAWMQQRTLRHNAERERGFWKKTSSDILQHCE